MHRLSCGDWLGFDEQHIPSITRGYTPNAEKWVIRTHPVSVNQKMDESTFREINLEVYVEQQHISTTAGLQRTPHARSRTHNSDQSNDGSKEMREKVNEYRVPTPNHYSTSSVRTLSISLFNIVGVISSTWTVIKLSAATLLYAATLPRFGVSSSAPNGCLSRAITWSARICLSVCDSDDGVAETLRLEWYVHQMVAQGEQRAVLLVSAGRPMRYRKG